MTDTRRQPRNNETFRHLPEQLYRVLAILKDAETPEDCQEPIEGWNNALDELYVFAAHSTKKKPLTPKMVEKAVGVLQGALVEAFRERGHELDPVTYQEWEAIAQVLFKAGREADAAARGG